MASLNDNLWSWLSGSASRPPEQSPPAAPTTVQLETIGREHSGKTALRTTILLGPGREPMPSRLELTSDDPRILASQTAEMHENIGDLSRKGLLSTADTSVFEYHLFEADRKLTVLQSREVVGQILTHTSKDSPDDQQRKYDEYVANLSAADVLQVVMPLPAWDSPADLERYDSDMSMHAAYLREALKVRRGHRPCSVAIVLNKIDTRFDDADEARRVLTDEMLRKALWRLVQICEVSEKVGAAAIWPVSALGFGTTVVAPTEEMTTATNGTTQNGRTLSAVSQGETEWILRPGARPQPFNLTGLIWWVLMTGLLHKPADGAEFELARIANLLANDLTALGAWYVPLDCRVEEQQ